VQDYSKLIIIKRIILTNYYDYILLFQYSYKDCNVLSINPLKICRFIFTRYAGRKLQHLDARCYVRPLE